MNNIKSRKEDATKWLAEIKKQAYVKECFHKDSNCSSKIIFAHSIQNNRILKKISQNGEVLYWSTTEDNDNNDIKFLLSRTGRKKATTFTGFCNFHDTKLFTPIELHNYHDGNEKQQFIFAYRALAKEYHAKRMAVNLVNSAISQLPQHRKAILGNFQKNQKITLYQLEQDKQLFNSALAQGKFNIAYTWIMKFHHEYHIAVSSAFTVEKDLNGKDINNFSDLDTDMKYLYLTIFPQNGKTYILLSCLRKYKKYLSPLINQIKEKSINERKIILSNILATHVENLAISPSKWEQISEDKRSVFQQLFQDTIIAENDSMTQIKNINLFV
ncbi:hypothetical protein VB713_06320 [Anabaena cylindrica UHCC 0172]|uniref:hypothetical protein n=1 Tax=Anabaena cylindrica TaxID=1165 RepID=UPI002B1F6BC8|nr:hypothetical protein [Anabaena cylindrica]MEA5550596.1 hypothetical protein [Anabaena cylindrica UHCC 0172]